MEIGKAPIGIYLFICVSLLASIQKHDVLVTNVEIPIRVFRGDVEVMNLNRTDFLVLEDGVPQDIEAFYIIENGKIARQEATSNSIPNIVRHFYLFFFYYEYEPKIKEALAYFISSVIKPTDTVTIVTPSRSYSLKNGDYEENQKIKLIDRLNSIIRKDILAGNSAYRAVLNDLKRMVIKGGYGVENAMGTDYEALTFAEDSGSGSGSIEEYFHKYRADLERLEELRSWDEKKLIEFAAYMRNQAGQKSVYFFYQREFIPVPDKNTLTMLENNMVLKLITMDAIDFLKRDALSNIEKIRMSFTNASMVVNFLYLTTSPNDIPRAQAIEHSEDVYIPLSEMAKSTGGITVSSASSMQLMKQASRAVDNYYLIFYSPKNRNVDGGYRKIEVRVVGSGIKVIHRDGYYAR